MKTPPHRNCRLSECAWPTESDREAGSGFGADRNVKLVPPIHLEKSLTPSDQAMASPKAHVISANGFAIA